MKPSRNISTATSAAFIHIAFAFALLQFVRHMPDQPQLGDHLRALAVALKAMLQIG